MAKVRVPSSPFETTLTPNWSVSVRLNNALGKRYELVQGYNTPGRNLFVWLAYAEL